MDLCICQENDSNRKGSDAILEFVDLLSLQFTMLPVNDVDLVLSCCCDKGDAS
jgi:hypothetical protein